MSVIIVGGGMVGAVLTLAISYMSNGQLPVHLIEAISPWTLDHSEFDSRAIALVQGTCQQLSRIGIWKIISDCATPIRTVHVSDKGHIGCVTLDARDYHIDALGQVVEIQEVKFRLFRLLQEAQGVTLHCPTRVANITRNELNVEVTLDEGTMLKAELLVAADGSHSTLASQCGIIWQQKSYDQIAVIANVSTSISYEGHAWERFTEYGPLAMLPMSYGRYSMVWCHPITKKNEILSLSDEHFCNKLQKVFGWQLGHITHTEKRIYYPLSLSVAQQFITHRVALVGNAAQTLHPVAGQGFNLGLRDAIDLSEILVQAWSRQQDCGTYSILSRYQQRRQSDKATTVNLSDGLVALFANHWTPLVIGRNIGLIVLDLFPPIQNVLVQRALGWVTTC